MEYIAADLRPLAVPIDSVVLDPGNANTHDEQSLAAITASLKQFGQRKPLVVNVKTGVIAAGNGTWAAAPAAGWSHIAVVRVKDDAQAHVGYAIADNRTAEFSKWDEVRLAECIADLEDEMPALHEALALAELAAAAPGEEPAAVEVTDSYAVMVECSSEKAQKKLYKELTAAGHKCKVLTL